MRTQGSKLLLGITVLFSVAFIVVIALTTLDPQKITHASNLVPTPASVVLHKGPGPKSKRANASPYVTGRSEIPPRKDGAPLTESDVKQYVTTHEPAIGPTMSNSAPTVKKMQLMTGKDARTYLSGSDIGRPDNDMVYIVELHGPFTAGYMHLPAGTKYPDSIDSIFEVFDAHTGNLLEWGTE